MVLELLKQCLLCYILCELQNGALFFYKLFFNTDLYFIILSIVSSTHYFNPFE